MVSGVNNSLTVDRCSTYKILQIQHWKKEHPPTIGMIDERKNMYKKKALEKATFMKNIPYQKHYSTN